MIFKKKEKLISGKQQELFQKRQSEIYPAIARELISESPEHWSSIVLELEDTGESLSHLILSDEGHKDVVVASMDLFESTRELELLFKEHGSMFKSAKFKVWFNDNQEWQFNVQYQYHT